MSPFLFWFFALLMLGFGAAVVLNRNPVASALSLVLSFLGLAALFMGLDAFFIGIIQVLVYAGAVMVLFLFIIMLLDLRPEKRRPMNTVAFVGGLLVVTAFMIQLATVVGGFKQGREPFPPLAGKSIDDVRNVGTVLFTDYNFHLQILGVLLLVATVGVVVLSRKQSES
jgi:NADH-quinone oxidoreductase subunit J